MAHAPASRLQALAPSLFVEMRRRVADARARGIDVISLGLGDPDEPTPPHIVEALQRAVSDPSLHRYPLGGSRGEVAYREAVAAFYGRRFGVAADPGSEILALIGSKEGSHHLALGLLDAGDVVVVPDPAYQVYEASARLVGAQVRFAALRPEHGFLVDFDEIEAMTPAPKVVWLSYPNNPTAATATLDLFERAVAFGHRTGALIVNDNPYSEVTLEGPPTPSILQVEGAMDVAVELGSLSKTYRMTGWRLGFAVGAGSVIAAMLRVKETVDTGPFSALQAAGAVALNGPQDAVAASNQRYRARRDVVMSALDRLGITVDPPRATFYLWAPAPDGMTGEDLANALLTHAGVVVNPGVAYGREGERYVRFALTVADDRLEEAVARIAAVPIDRLAAITA
jgi:LL-diaminopimelate aminotransferase